MADSFIQLAADSSGKKIDTRTEGTNTEHRQVVILGDPATNAGVAAVDATNGLSVNVTNASLTVGTHAVTQSGTWTVQPGNTANTTAWLAKVGDGTNTAAIKAASTAAAATDPSLVVALSPNGLNANGQTTMANSAPVTIASNQTSVKTVTGGSEYETVAASQTDQTLGATGGTGDYLEGLVCVVATAATSQVQIKDGAGSAITVLPNAVGAGIGTYYVPLGLISTGGAWKVTTAAGVSVIGTGDFT